MEIDQATFYKLVLERSNSKLNELQSRVLILETQLQLALEENQKLINDLNKLNKKEKKSEFTN
jgi:hypothetical protein